MTVVFGVRYLDDPASVLARLARLLGPGGRVVVVDFVGPGPSVLSRAAWFYFSRILPGLAGALAHRRELYDRLLDTTRDMGGRDGPALAIVREAGLEPDLERPMGFGLVLGVEAVQAPSGDPSDDRDDRGPGYLRSPADPAATPRSSPSADRTSP